MSDEPNLITECLNIDDQERRQPSQIKQLPPIASTANTQQAFGAESPSQLLAQAEYVVKKLGHLHIDVTAHYPDWLAVGFAFAEPFAEMGRPLFHSLSALYPNYSADETQVDISKPSKDDSGSSETPPTEEGGGGGSLI